jgi:hypothetical protein
MSGQSIEVDIEAITGEDWQAARGQAPSQGVDEQVCHVLSAGTQRKHRKKLRARIDGQPEPQHLCGAAQPGAQFVQLQVREVQMAEEALVQGVRVLASTGQPGGNGGLSKAEDPFGCGRVQSFGQRREHHGDLVRGGFQTIQRRVVSSTERGAAGLATKGLDPLNTAMLAIPDQRMNVCVCQAEVGALRVGAGETLGVYPLGCSSTAFHLTPGSYWCRSRSVVGGTQATERAIKWGAGLEQMVDQSASAPCLCMGMLQMRPKKATKQREREEEADHEQKLENVENHNDPRRLK